MMTKTESVVRSIFGITRMNPTPLIVAVDVAIELVFHRGLAMDDILVTKLLYPEVAKRLGSLKGTDRNWRSVARCVERLANFCWDTMQDRALTEEYLGAALPDIRAPRDMIFYLAFLVYLDTPYFIAIRQTPQLLF